jgi:hypothetical protein
VRRLNRLWNDYLAWRASDGRAVCSPEPPGIKKVDVSESDVIAHRRAHPRSC